MSTMTMSASRSSVFTFESTVHSCHMLRCLDDQRRRDVLCDITVVVEGQSFRAHRSVLASCSEFFTHRFSSFMQHGAVITLPKEVTVEGFEPLLNFAYTSKLLFGKEDVLEIRSAASILGFQDLDDGCFDFVLPKFFSNSRSSAQSHDKTCCKKKCKRRLSKEDGGSDCDDVPLDEKEVKPVADSSAQQETTWDCDKSVNNKMGSQRSAGPDAPAVEEANNNAMRCPKYRKFQLACGKENCAAEKGLAIPEVPVGDEGPVSFSPCFSSGMTHHETAVPFSVNSTSNVCKQQKQPAGDRRDLKTKTWSGRPNAHVDSKETQTGDRNCEDMETDVMKTEREMEPVTGISSAHTTTAKAVFSESNAPRAERSLGLILNHNSPFDLNEGPASTRSLAQGGFVGGTDEGEKAGEHQMEKEQERGGEADNKTADKTQQTCRMEKVPLSGKSMRDRNMAERGIKPPAPLEPAVCSSQLSLQHLCAGTSDKGSGCTSLEWLKLDGGFSPVGSSCPDFRDLPQQKCSWQESGLPECEGASQSGASPLNSGEDGDSETETEGDSESYTQERARQVQLPFSVDWVVNLNRNDFQQLLKHQVFTREQLDFVHDMRRRSKNRLAAQRCRKRKLDCIYNLQCEINKLKTEREKLMMEKSHLSQLKMKTCQSVSALCQRVCSEASLQPEQLQVLAKYTSPDCPLSSFFPHIDALLTQQRLPHGLAAEELQFSSSTDTFMGKQ